MGKKLLLIVGHPDPDRARFCYALADAYASGAEIAGHEVKRIELADIEMPVLRSYQDFYGAEAPPQIKKYQEDLKWADHWVILFPIWLGTMPAQLKIFFEQVIRPDFAFDNNQDKFPKPLLQGKSAHIIVTMGMPGWAYRWYYKAHGVKNLKRNILHFSGIKPVRLSFIGMVESNAERRLKWLAKIKTAGRKAA